MLICFFLHHLQLVNLTDGVNMFQSCFFDLDKQIRKLDNYGDTFFKIYQAVDWEIFRPSLGKARQKPRKFVAGPMGYDVILFFNMFVLWSMYTSPTMQPGARFLADTPLVISLVCVLETRSSMQLSFGVFVKILQWPRC